MSLGVLTTKRAWRRNRTVPVQTYQGAGKALQASFTMDSPAGKIRMRVSALLVGKTMEVSFDRNHAPHRRNDAWALRLRYSRGAKHRKRFVSYLDWLAKLDTPAARHILREMQRMEVSVSPYVVLATVADIVKAWIREYGVETIRYAGSTAAHAKVYRTMIRLAMPGAVLINHPIDALDDHEWRVA